MYIDKAAVFIVVYVLHMYHHGEMLLFLFYIYPFFLIPSYRLNSSSTFTFNFSTILYIHLISFLRKMSLASSFTVLLSVSCPNVLRLIHML